MITLDARFWAKVDRTGDGCWEWTAHRDRAGYGRINVGQVPALAHRLSWWLTNGAIPDGLFVCHHCDNPPCVRPDHLFLGTPRDNNDDKLAKGRGTPPPQFRGLVHHNAEFADDVIRGVRESYAAGREMQSEIAARLGVAQTTVSAWVTGRLRPEAGGPIVPRRRRATRAQMASRRSA